MSSTARVGSNFVSELPYNAVIGPKRAKKTAIAKTVPRHQSRLLRLLDSFRRSVCQSFDTARPTAPITFHIGPHTRSRPQELLVAAASAQRYRVYP
eukprot:3478177-Pleurochrysis_carterae.AAC.2